MKAPENKLWLMWKMASFRGAVQVIDATYDVSMGDEGLAKALRRINTAAEKAIGWGYQMLVRLAYQQHAYPLTLQLCGLL
jgi:hypothetical protein